MGYLLSTILLKQFTHHMKNDFKNINSSIKNCQVQIRRNNKDIFNAIKISLYFNDIQINTIITLSYIIIGNDLDEKIFNNENQINKFFILLIKL